MFGVGVGVRIGGRTASSSGGFDPDAQAFFDRVTTAGGTLSTTEKNTTNQLVLDMKSAGIWTSMKAVYPMVGASAAACAQNLKSSSFTGTFSSGWTFASTGVTPNGTSAYMDTGLNALSNLTLTSTHLSAYVRNNTLGSQYDLGCSADISAYSNATALITRYFNNTSYIEIGGGGYGTSTSMSNSQGFTFGTTNGSRVQNLYKNGTLIVSSSSNANNFANKNVYLGAINGGGTPTFFSDKQYALCSIGDGLDATQQSNFYTAVQTFNQTLNRQVGAQIVSDADAQAYINRVYTAGGTLTNTEANAVNQLTIDMKAAGIWTAMKAVYPMVGSSAAACAQNLKSSSFTGSFSSGWTFASTGVTPNGTSAFMNTSFIPSTNGLTYDNNHLSFYSRTSAQSGAIQFYEMGSGNATGTDNLSLFVRRSTDLAGYDSGDFTTNRASFTNTNGQGFYCGTAPNTTSKYFKNGVSQVSKSLSVKSISGVNVYIGAFNENNVTTYYSQKECAFASLGLGLTDTQALNFYTAVQTFNQTLNRQV